MLSLRSSPPRFLPSSGMSLVLLMGTFWLLACDGSFFGADPTCGDACGSGTVCDEGICRSQCEVDSHCDPDGFCIAGICRPLTLCETTGQCRGDEACLDGLCIPTNRECVTDAMCDDGFCDEGVCRSGTRPIDNGPGSGAPCESDDDCSDGLICFHGTCGTGSQNDDGGGGDDGATDGEGDDGSGDDGGGDGSNDPCEGRANGVFGDRCQASADCCEGLCVGRPSEAYGMCTQGCMENADCNEGGGQTYFCSQVADAGKVCLQNDYGTMCTEATHCNGQICLNAIGQIGGKCSYRCHDIHDCPTGTTCGAISAMDQFGNDVTVRVCTPIGESCFRMDNGLNDCLSQICYTGSEGAGGGYCTTFCFESEDPPCPQDFVCRTLVEDGYTFCIYEPTEE